MLLLEEATTPIKPEEPIIFAVATPAAQTVARATKDIPVVATAITSFEAAKLVKSDAAPGGNVTGVSDIGPVGEQLKLLLKFVPGAKRIGTMYCSSEANSAYQTDLLKKAAEPLGVEIVESTVTNVNDIQQAMASLRGKVDGIYVPTDNVLASAIPALMKVVIPSGLPIVVGEGGMVRSGALATIAVDYYTLGLMTGRMGADILEGKSKPAEMPIQSQPAEKIIINMATAREMNIAIPEELKAKAELINN